MRPWVDPPNTIIPALLRQKIPSHPLTLELLVRRGLQDPTQALAFLDPNHYMPASPYALPGLSAAVERIELALQKHEHICIWGDFDVDGQTSTALLFQALTSLGAHVQHYIPVRARESHGVHVPSLEPILAQGVSLVVTCDTGIAAHAAIEHARQRGVDFVVTDHHELPPNLPAATALVNPRFLPSDHALANLPGVGVAYQLALALYERAGRAAEADAFLDLVALGIIADVAVLQGDTRYLAQRGLNVLRQTSRLGLQALFSLAEINPAGITEEHIGFIIGPRLNALGRLADANLAVEFFTTTQKNRAHILAIELEGLNAQRQLLTEQILRSAEAQIERDRSLLDDFVLVLHHSTWPAGIIGIVASRLVEKHGRPVILLAAPSGELARGSARSIPGVNITAAIASQANLLEGYGGHPMAAGLSIKPERLPQFRKSLSSAIAQQVSQVLPVQPLNIDAYINLDEITLEFISDLTRIAPFGAGNPPVVLATRNVHIRSRRKVGRSGEHQLIQIADERDAAQPVMWWQSSDEAVPEGLFDLAYTVRATSYRGQSAIQTEWVSARPIDGISEVSTAPGPSLRWQDFRNHADPQQILETLRQQSKNIIVWAEGTQIIDKISKTRLELHKAHHLVVWTIPPSRQELRQALEQVQPDIVTLFAIDPLADLPETFVPRLAGLVKYALNHYAGIIQPNRLAAACAQRQVAILTGLDWLAAKGMLAATTLDENQIQITRGSGITGADFELTDLRLKAILAETVAFRNYYRRVDPESLT